MDGVKNYTSNCLKPTMDKNSIVVCAAVIAAAAAVAATVDGHVDRASPTETYTVRDAKWPKIRDDTGMDGWFRRKLRCSRYVYLRIVAKVEDAWASVHKPLHHNTVFGIEDRVACCLHYVTHSDGYDETGTVFGISKTQTRKYVREVVQVLTICYLNEAITMPSSVSEWEQVREGFELAGFPNCYGAIDGSLISIKRFADYEGWYCRKGFPAFNIQGFVDHKLRFRSYSLRSGSQNDKALFNASKLGKTLHKCLPTGGCVLADAGYKLFRHLLTPYPIYYGMPPEEAHYNLIHSRTRIIVEQAFGLWKNVFRIFKTAMIFDTPEEMAMFVEATLILHNWFIQFNENSVEDIPQENEDWMYIGGDDVYDHELNTVDGDEALLCRNRIKSYLWDFVQAD